MRSKAAKAGLNVGEVQPTQRRNVKPRSSAPPARPCISYLAQAMPSAYFRGGDPHIRLQPLAGLGAKEPIRYLAASRGDPRLGRKPVIARRDSGNEIQTARRDPAPRRRTSTLPERRLSGYTRFRVVQDHSWPGPEAGPGAWPDGEKAGLGRLWREMLQGWCPSHSGGHG